ncbi:protein ENHANCED DISEASE RESISTANCE 2-like isoform X2 [Malus sylvestris]|uniref:protein ENHANCED DISEASE RESISTANCE 2-like isoform X2 n=1 Tax=Malus sylvestris TaxID=3752 RepID=UPI0021AD3579|nr:protein ENHANCED DISEASE RESISTANCE 2-like isoform X2 [Malus sylvestris]
MGIPQNDGKMEGWLYIIGSNRFGLQYSRKRYFILKDNCLRSFKAKPSSDSEEPVRSAVIDTCIRATDNGRASIHRKGFFVFTLYNTSNNSDQLKLGASSSEEAAKWIRSLQDAALKACPNATQDFVACSKSRWPSFRRTERKNSVDWTFSPLMHTEGMTSDVIAPSPWKIFGCQNGLRLFKEAKDWDSRGRHWDDHPAIMAVGVVDGTSEAIFRTLLSLGPSRSEWDFCYYQGSVVERLDGHTDIIHQQLYSDWLPWGMQRRDLLIRRYWRREDDGTYVILYHSVSHKKCPPKRGYVRACLKSGGFVITPANQGKQSLVRHMLAIDWKFWKLYLRPSSARCITIRMLERVAALRELFGAKAGTSSPEFSSGDMSSEIKFSQSGQQNIKTEVQHPGEVKKMEEGVLVEDEVEKPEGRASLKGLHDAADEFFDVPEPTEYDQFENEWPSDVSMEQNPTSIQHHKLSSAAVLVKKLHELRVQKKGYMDLQEVCKEDSVCPYGATLQKDPSCALPCSWGSADPSSFLIRGPNYLRDRQKIKAKSTLMQLVGVDWLRSDKREDDLGSRYGNIVQKSAERGGSEFFFIVNIQVPGTTMYTLAFYYMIKTPLEETPLLHAFVNGDDSYRNSRFKLIPYISKGSWIVKQSVGKKACLVGQALEVHYFRGKNYLELGVDVGSSTVARGVVNLVLGYLNNLVIEMAFLIQANTEEELPEVLLGTCRINQLDASKSVLVKP